MKKIYTFLTASFMSLMVFAGGGYNDGKLSVSYLGSDNIKVAVDGYSYDNSYNNNDYRSNSAVMIDNIRPGYHTITVSRSRRKGFFGWGKRDDLIYSTSVYVKPRTFVDIVINRFGRAFVDEQRLDNNGNWNGNDYPNDNDNHHYGDQDNGNNGGWNNGYGNVMNDRDFSTVKDQLRKEWFENNRLTSARTIIDGSNFTTQQVKDLMFLFTFENNRLELAKYAYRKTVDKQNYYQLNDALTFSSSKDELARFIRESH
jgi:hypothetical protein